MKLRPGCGCLLMVMGLANSFFTIAALYGLITGSAGRVVTGLSFTLFLANAGFCFVSGWTAIRMRLPRAGRGEEVHEGGDEGEDTEADG